MTLIRPEQCFMEVNMLVNVMKTPEAKTTRICLYVPAKKEQKQGTNFLHAK